ncbi:MAG: Ig-like domain-containing protein [Oscillospiraceae bacterium]
MSIYKSGILLHSRENENIEETELREQQVSKAVVTRHIQNNPAKKSKTDKSASTKKKNVTVSIKSPSEVQISVSARAKDEAAKREASYKKSIDAAELRNISNAETDVPKTANADSTPLPKKENVRVSDNEQEQSKEGKSGKSPLFEVGVTEVRPAEQDEREVVPIAAARSENQEDALPDKEREAEKNQNIFSKMILSEMPQAEPTPSNKNAQKYAALKIVMCIMAFTAAAFFGGYVHYLNSQPPEIGAIAIADSINEDMTVTVEIPISSPHFLRTELWCALTQSRVRPTPDDSVWVRAENGNCIFNVREGEYFVYAMDSRGNASLPDEDPIELEKIVSISVNKDMVYLALNGHETLSAELFVLGSKDETVTWTSSDPSVATVQDGLVSAISAGNATVTASSVDGQTDEVSVLVTELIGSPNINTGSKPLLVGTPYTDEEAHLLDRILADMVQSAGYGTRAGTVAAARFLSLQFKYRVPYFFENGRLNPHNGRPRCDGEGRYYHQGLFLCKCKYDDLDPVRYGPAMWGHPLMNFEEKYAFKKNQKYPNGLDCSGFVTWCLINGGSDVGDMGAGEEYGNNDLCDLGEKIYLSAAVLKSDRIRVGDLIASDGHMAIIIGLEENRIYIAESLFTSVRVTNFPRNYSVIASGLYDYVIPMEDIYNGDGNLTDMFDLNEGS